MSDNKTLIINAKQSLSGKWATAIQFVILSFIINLVVAIPSIINQMAPLDCGKLSVIVILGASIAPFIQMLLTFGVYVFYLQISREKDYSIWLLFAGFKKIGVVIFTSLLAGFFLILWALLLIIPGIIAIFSYSQVYFILADNDRKERPGPLSAIKESKKMMKGKKWKLFCLHLRFLGWGLLVVLTLGLASVYVSPLWFTTLAKFYEDNKITS